MVNRTHCRAATLLLAGFLLLADTAAFGADNTAAFGDDNTAAVSAGEPREPSFGEEPAPPPAVADPIEPVNRAMFAFNDKAYFWVLKPVAEGYNYVVPEGARVSVRNFFSNLATPVRLVNNLLQGDIRASGTELLRFTINSTMGILGLFDTARDGFHVDRKEADLGQTFGKYGLGQGMYIVLPILGPTTLRDGVGTAGDLFLDPVTYLNPVGASIGVKSYKTENGLSLRIGEYEKLKDSALDPYVAVRDAYVQHREKVVNGKPSPLP